jgi:hypothetical protein
VAGGVAKLRKENISVALFGKMAQTDRESVLNTIGGLYLQGLLY